MKKHTILFFSILMTGIVLTGCERPAKETEKATETAVVTESETTVAEKISETEPVTETTVSTPDSGDENVSSPEDSQDIKSQESADLEEYEEVIVTDSIDEEEEYFQCPYCAHWFTGDVYESHVQEERENDPSGGETEEEMVQCPDCGEWFEAGNVFRNHICSGR